MFDQVEVHAAGGYPFVVQVVDHHNSNPTIKDKGVAVIDGDNPPLKEPNDFVLTLPRGAPETIVFGYIYENAAAVAALVQQRCQCPSASQDFIVKVIGDVMIDTTDHHLYFAKLGERLGFISELVVRRGLCSIYVQNSKGELMSLVDGLRKQLGL
jgi:hypothetical protein